jgi:putative nucleotidyltransferase with HDIG domain
MRLFRSTLLLMLAACAVTAAVGGAALLRTGPHEARSVLVAAGAGFVAALLLSFAFARNLSRQVSQVVGVALEVARGRFGREVSVTARNEIGELAYTFNHMSRELASYDRENKELIERLERGYLATISALASAIDAKDPYTRGHSQRVSHWAVEIGRELGLEGEELRALEYGGLLHDIGKIGVPENLLLKASALDESEMQVMRRHPAIGSEILRQVEFLRRAAHAVRNHHERWDGAGYPDGLSGEGIPMVARIVNAADTWDACRSRRPYQAPMTVDDALAVVDRLKGSQLDPHVCEALVRAVRRREAISVERRSQEGLIAPFGPQP